MKQIIVGLDAHPEPVADWAARFASDVGARVTAVHVVPRTTLWMVSSVQADSNRYIDTTRSYLERHALDPMRLRGVVANLQIRRGEPAHQLAQAAQRSGAEFIVIGASDHSAIHDAFNGTVAHRLEHCTDVPIVIVPAQQ